MIESVDIAQWRARIFRIMKSIVFNISVLGTSLATRNNLPRMVWIVVVALVCIMAIWRLNIVPIRVQAVDFIATMYGVAVGGVLAVGANDVSGVCCLIAISVISVVRLGMRPTLLSIALVSTSILVLGLAGYISPPIAIPGTTLALPVFTLGLISLSIIRYTRAQMRRRLMTSLEQARDAAPSCDKREDSLHALDGKLRLTSAALASLNEMVLIAKIAPAPSVALPITFVNAAFERWSGYREDEIIGCSVHMLQRPGTDHAFVADTMHAIAQCEPFSTEFEAYNRGDCPSWLEIEMAPFAQDRKGELTHWVVVARDITEKKRSAAAIHQLAYFDALTCLPNRRMLMDRLETLIVKARAKHEFGAVLYIDLDNFKKVNDARGHATGDALLKVVADRLSGMVGICDTVARLGGDEFIVVLEDLGNDVNAATGRALAKARDICAILQHPYHIAGQIYYSSSSIGVALHTALAQTAQDLLREADTAMYGAKSSGCNCVVLFEPSMRVSAEAALTIEFDLVNAIHNDELVLHFQLQFDCEGYPVGAEALVRWQRPDGTLVAPSKFIDIAETTGLIIPLGNWVLHQASLAWCQLDRSGFPMPLSVNVSPSQFRQPDFVAGVRSVLAHTGMPAHQLILEVTEGMLVDNLEQVIAKMDVLAAIGVRFSIDDFGTGYSNLRYLRKMPLYELKIDKSFVHDVPNDANDTAIVRTMLLMARSLGLHVVAEGIETEEQADFFRKDGAHTLQGYLFCTPVPLESLMQKLLSLHAG